MKKMLQDLVSPIVTALDPGSSGKTVSSTTAAGSHSVEDSHEFLDTCANFHDDFPDTQAGTLNN